MSLLKSQPPKPQPLSDSARQAILDREIAWYAKNGYRVVSRDQFTAQLIKEKHFSCFWATLWTLCFGIGLLFYVFWYMSQKEKSVYLSVGVDGKISRTMGRVG